MCKRCLDKLNGENLGPYTFNSQCDCLRSSACHGLNPTSTTWHTGKCVKEHLIKSNPIAPKKKRAKRDHGNLENGLPQELEDAQTLLNFALHSTEATPIKKSRKTTLRHSYDTVEALRNTVSCTLQEEVGKWKSMFSGEHQELAKLAKSMKEEIAKTTKYIQWHKTIMEELFGGMDTKEKTLSLSTISTDGSLFPICSDSSTDTQCLSEQQVDTFISALGLSTSHPTEVQKTGTQTSMKIKEEPLKEESPAPDTSPKCKWCYQRMDGSWGCPTWLNPNSDHRKWTNGDWKQREKRWNDALILGEDKNLY